MELRERKDGQLHARASGERLKANFSFLGMKTRAGSHRSGLSGAEFARTSLDEFS
jgi:hypothetical protein